MKFGKINIHVDYATAGISSKDGYKPYMDAYLLDDQVVKRSRPAVIICPGGGYEFCAEREAEPVAMQFLKEGIQTFVLWYSVKPNVFPTALLELATAVKTVRDHAGEWNIDPEKIVIMGFSAGGHLAGSLSVMWNKGFVETLLQTSRNDIKPNGSILCYPVITSGEKAHRGSFENLLQGLPNEYFIKTSLEKQVDTKTPPTFIWHTWTDDDVPVENTLLYVNALKEHNISCECHIFKEGPHGLSLSNDEVDDGKIKIMPSVSIWMDLAIRWLKDL